jgi:hypothetical protein
MWWRTTTAGIALLAASTDVAADFERTAYSDAAFEAALASGRPVLLVANRLHAPGTACPDQWQVIARLADDPSTSGALVMLIDADGPSPPLHRFRIAYDCTLVAFRDGVETGRRLGTVDPTRIRALFDPAR